MTMTFAEFLLRTNLHHTVVARAMGVSPEALRRYRYGDRLPVWPVLVRLAELSKGNVTPNDFLPLAKRRLKDAVEKGKKRRKPTSKTGLSVAAE
jgi:transcriptional regulator with XRE-family HTH domain